MSRRWSVEQVEAIAPKAAAITAAQPIATPTRWAHTGADERVVWGSFQGSGAEPYETAVDHATVGFRCTCPSRQSPCKHALALLLLWVRGHVPDSVPDARVDAWVSRRHQRSSDGVGDTGTSGGGDASGHAEPSADDVSAIAGGRDTVGDGTAVDGDDSVPPPPPDDDRDQARDERVERMFAGLTELDRWLEDRMRTGLADPAIARYSTWDQLAARLVDAQAGSLANRVRRLAGLVGASPDWHDDVLAELGILHLLAQAGRRLGRLPSSLADAVATTVGWQVRQADVLAGVPDTDEWVVAGRSDVREDRIEVRRHWLRGSRSGRWALVLSFAAYRQSLDDSLVVGTAIEADLHRYPGPALRAIVGRRSGEPVVAAPPTQNVEQACDEIGAMVAAEPWLDRVPSTVTASIARSGDRWFLTDETGSLPVLDAVNDRGPGRAALPGIATLLAAAGGRPVDLTIEWTPHGVLPLAVHESNRSIDVGPRADPSFVGAV